MPPWPPPSWLDSWTPRFACHHRKRCNGKNMITLLGETREAITIDTWKRLQNDEKEKSCEYQSPGTKMMRRRNHVSINHLVRTLGYCVP